MDPSLFTSCKCIIANYIHSQLITYWMHPNNKVTQLNKHTPNATHLCIHSTCDGKVKAGNVAVMECNYVH